MAILYTTDFSTPSSEESPSGWKAKLSFDAFLEHFPLEEVPYARFHFPTSQEGYSATTLTYNDVAMALPSGERKICVAWVWRLPQAFLDAVPDFKALGLQRSEGSPENDLIVRVKNDSSNRLVAIIGDHDSVSSNTYTSTNLFNFDTVPNEWLFMHAIADLDQGTFTLSVTEQDGTETVIEVDSIQDTGYFWGRLVYCGALVVEPMDVYYDMAHFQVGTHELSPPDWFLIEETPPVEALEEITITSTGSGEYVVYADDVEVSSHASEKDAIAAAINALILDPDADIEYVLDYRVAIAPAP